jgi:ASCH domain
MTETIDLNAMSIAQLKEYYASLNNPATIEGDKRRKESWINAIEKSMNVASDRVEMSDEAEEREGDLINLLLSQSEYLDFTDEKEEKRNLDNRTKLEISSGKYEAYFRYSEYSENIDFAFIVDWYNRKICLIRELYNFIDDEAELISTNDRLKRVCSLIINQSQGREISLQESVDLIRKGAIAPKAQETICDNEIPFYEPYELYTEEKEQEEKEQEQTESKQEIFGVPISFGKTLDRLLQGIKTVTRRVWKDDYAQMFINAYQKGKLIQAFDKNRKYGGKLIGYLEISDIYQESIFDMPESDVSAEGYPELNWSKFADKFFYDLVKDLDESKAIVWVIRFKFVPVPDHVSVLRNHGFRPINLQKFYDRQALGQAMIQCDVNGWKIFLSSDNRKHTTIRFLSQQIILMNSLGEMWVKEVDPCHGYDKCVLIGKKVILDIGYNLPTAHYKQEQLVY